MSNGIDDKFNESMVQEKWGHNSAQVGHSKVISKVGGNRALT